MKKYLSVLIAVFAGILIGFFAGRKTIDTSERVRYVKGDPYAVHVPVGLPEKESVLSSDLKLLDVSIPENVSFADSADLAPTAYDWNMKREYTQLLFDNQYGRLTVDAVVQYNKLESLTPTFIPLQKEVVIYRQKVIQPFVMGSYGTFNNLRLGGGVFYHNVGLSINYVTDFNRKGVDVGLMYKF